MSLLNVLKQCAKVKRIMASHSYNILISGGAKGIGRGLSRLLLLRGHRVFILDHDNNELTHHAQRLAKDHEQGVAFDTAVCNLRKLDEIKTVVAQASQLFNGHLDVLINNAAYTAAVGAANASNITPEQWSASVETNLTAPLFLSQFCLPLLQSSSSRARGGSIIHMSSTRAFMSEADNEAYSATKAGLLGLTQSMAVSLAPKGVRTNAILPGWINVSNENKEADETGQSWEDGLTEDDHQWHLSGRVGKVEDILSAVLYLAESEFVSGTELVVDGGVTRKMVYPE